MRRFWLSAVVAAILPGNVIYAATGTTAAAGTSAAGPVVASYATYKNNGAVTQHLFTTKPVNEMPKAIPPTEQLGADASFVDNYYGKVNAQFNCPQHMFLSGIKATYGAFITSGGYNNSSYVFEYTCALLQLDQATLVQKASCGQDFSPADNMPEIPPAKEGEEKKPEPPKDPRAIHDLPAGILPAPQAESACAAGQFIQGLTYVKYFGRKVMADAFYKSYCCNVVDGAQKPLAATSNCKTQSFPAATSFVMECGENMIVQKITSTFDDKARNRSFEITCCQVGK
jgi:hypothetical protein